MSFSLIFIVQSSICSTYSSIFSGSLFLALCLFSICWTKIVYEMKNLIYRVDLFFSTFQHRTLFPFFKISLVFCFSSFIKLSQGVREEKKTFFLASCDFVFLHCGRNRFLLTCIYHSTRSCCFFATLVVY